MKSIDYCVAAKHVAGKDKKMYNMLLNSVQGKPVSTQDPSKLQEFYTLLSAASTDKEEKEGYAANVKYYGQVKGMLAPGGICIQPGW